MKPQSTPHYQGYAQGTTQWKDRPSAGLTAAYRTQFGCNLSFQFLKKQEHSSDSWGRRGICEGFGAMSAEVSEADSFSGVGRDGICLPCPVCLTPNLHKVLEIYGATQWNCLERSYSQHNSLAELMAVRYSAGGQLFKTTTKQNTKTMEDERCISGHYFTCLTESPYALAAYKLLEGGSGRRLLPACSACVTLQEHLLGYGVKQDAGLRGFLVSSTRAAVTFRITKQTEQANI